MVFVSLTREVLVFWCLFQSVFQLFVGLRLGCVFLYRAGLVGFSVCLVYCAKLDSSYCRVSLGGGLVVICGRTKVCVFWSMIECRSVFRELVKNSNSQCWLAMKKFIAFKNFNLKEAPRTQCLGVHSALVKLDLIPLEEERPTVPFHTGTESHEIVTEIVVLSLESLLTILSLGHRDCSNCEHLVLLIRFSQSGQGFSFLLLLTSFVKLYKCTYQGLISSFLP